MSDLISRQDAIDALEKIFPANPMRNDYTQGITVGAALATEYIKQLPSVHPGCDEWCHDCKEYDQQKHSCPRWNRVIRQTVEDMRKEIPDTTRILAEVLTGSPLLHPCYKLWSREGWCKEHCKKGQTEPDTECWLKYAEVMAAKMEEGE